MFSSAGEKLVPKSNQKLKIWAPGSSPEKKRKTFLRGLHFIYAGAFKWMKLYVFNTGEKDFFKKKC